VSRQLRIAARTVLLMLLLGWADGARATYSIVACDAKTRECGVAVQTNNLAVGSSVPVQPNSMRKRARSVRGEVNPWLMDNG